MRWRRDDTNLVRGLTVEGEMISVLYYAMSYVSYVIELTNLSAQFTTILFFVCHV